MEALNLSDLPEDGRLALFGDIEDWLASNPGTLTKEQEYRQTIYQRLYNPELMECVGADLGLLKGFLIASRVTAELAL